VTAAGEDSQRIVLTCEGVTLDVGTPDWLAARVLDAMPHGARQGPVVDAPMIRFDVGAADANGATLQLEGDGVLWRGTDEDALLQCLRRELQLAVAVHAPERLFVHAGAVAWQGRAILLPGSSRAGKTSLVAALIAQGCDYYSDEFAIIDASGQLHAYPRPLRVRREVDRGPPEEVEPAALGARVGVRPIPVGMVVVTRFVPGATFVPTHLTTAQVLLQLLDHTVAVRRAPARALDWIGRAIDGVAALGGVRGGAVEAAARIVAEARDLPC